MSRIREQDCSNPPLTPKHGPIVLDGYHSADCDCVWVHRHTYICANPDATLAEYTRMRAEHGRQTANLWLLDVSEQSA